MGRQRIDARFAALQKQKRSGLVTYIMGCDPSRETCLEILKGLPKAGADIIELGMAFSDPMADGPTIQLAAQRAFKAGASVKSVLGLVKDFRKGDKETPLILMGYYNPIYAYGPERFVKDALLAGADGAIIVDLPPEEEEEFTRFATPAGFALVRLTTPTTDTPRAKIVLKEASGFVYYVSIAGITGTKSAKASNVKEAVERLKKVTRLPVAVGFGIKTRKDVLAIQKVADAAVVGSALVQKIELYQKSPKKAVAEALKFVRELSGRA
jgi:tryptophan synthase alpha chain